jgi:hypothetical protein
MIFLCASVAILLHQSSRPVQSSPHSLEASILEIAEVIESVRFESTLSQGEVSRIEAIAKNVSWPRKLNSEPFKDMDSRFAEISASHRVTEKGVMAGIALICSAWDAIRSHPQWTLSSAWLVCVDRQATLSRGRPYSTREYLQADTYLSANWPWRKTRNGLRLRPIAIGSPIGPYDSIFLYVRGWEERARGNRTVHPVARLEFNLL